MLLKVEERARVRFAVERSLTDHDMRRVLEYRVDALHCFQQVSGSSASRGAIAALLRLALGNELASLCEPLREMIHQREHGSSGKQPVGVRHCVTTRIDLIGEHGLDFVARF